MLVNKRYAGIHTYKGKETPGGIPRIISDELFNKVADMMEKNKKAPARARAKEDFIEGRVVQLARAQLTDESIAQIASAVAPLCEKEKESGDYKRLEKLRRDNGKQKANLVDTLKFGKATETLLEEVAKLGKH